MVRLRKVREERGWSMMELAYRARVSYSDLSRIETGRLIAYPPQLARLVKALAWPLPRAAELLEPMSNHTPPPKAP